MKDLPELVAVIVLMLVLAWGAAYDEEERHTLINKEVLNGHTKTRSSWQTEVKPTPSTRLLDSERVGGER